MTDTTPDKNATEEQLDLGLKIVGAFVATGLGFVAGLITAFYAPLRVPGSTAYLPVSLVLALGGNPLLSWFAYSTTGHRLAALLPALPWCAVWFVAASRTTEGDLIITGDNWVGLVTLLAGPIAFAVGVLVPARRALRAAPPAG